MSIPGDLTSELRFRYRTIFGRSALQLLAVLVIVAMLSPVVLAIVPTEQAQVEQIADEPLYISFKAATFDPLTESPVFPQSLSAKPNNNQYVVQMNGPVHEAQKDALVSDGAILLGYIPDYAFMAEMSPRELDNVMAEPFVRAVVPLHPAYKLGQSLWSETSDVQVRIDVHRGLDLVISKVISVGGTIDYCWENGLQAIVPGPALSEVAALSSVIWIERVPEWHISNDVAAGILNVNTTWNTYNLNGSGEIVAISDTGLDSGINDSSMHDDFEGRIVGLVDKWPGTDNASDTRTGHGTHVAGSVLGNGANSNGKVKGMAPGAKVYFQALERNNDGAFATQSPLDTWLFQPAYTAGARVHSNSWGASFVDGRYSSASSDVDDFVWNNDQMVIVYAVGNSGADTNSDGIVDLDSVDAPASAKNCIGVGASENLRASKNWAYDGGTFAADPIKSDKAANDPDGLAAFSSRGPLNDTRIKPDLVAPGTGILSTRSSKATGTGWGLPTTEANSQYYMFDGGTSMATPLVAGSAAVVRQFYKTNMSYASPSAALVKATLINGAYQMPGQYTSPKNETKYVWDYNQGWGRVDITNSLFPAPRDFYFEDKAHALSTGENFTYNFNVTGTLPFRVTLVWTDYPAVANANPALVNNLDLTLMAPNGTIYKGNKFTNGISVSGGTADNRNNVENVYFNTPVLGTWQIKVNAQNIPQGPQKYAIIFTGVFSAPPPSAPTLNSPVSGAYTSARPTFNLTTTDINGDDIRYNIELSKDNFASVWRTYNQSDDTTGWTKTKYASGENGYYTVKVGEELDDNVKYYWRALAWDGTGWSSFSLVNNFTVDGKPPTALSISIDSGKNSTASQSVTLTLSATDNYSGMATGLAAMSFSKDGLSWSSWETYSNSKAWTLENYQGVHRVYFRPRDAVGNVAEPVSSTITYDNVAPTGLTFALDNGASYTRDDLVNLTLSASDATSGLWQMSFSNDGTLWGTWENFASVRNGWNITDTVSGGNSNEGLKTVWFRVRDMSGNIAQKVTSQITYDKTAPSNTAMLINGGDLYTTSRLVNIFITGTDATSGISYMAMDTDGNGFGPWEPFTSTKYVVLPSCDGIYNIKIQLRDNAGNIGKTATASITYDCTPPSNITITPSVAITNDPTITLTLKADEKGSGLKDMAFSFDGQLWSQWETWATTKLLDLPLGDGTKSVYVRVMDEAGNIGGPARATLILDTTAPTVTLSLNSNADYINSTAVQIQFSLLDGFDLTGYEVTLSNDGTTWSSWTPLASSMAWTISSGDGEKRVYAKVRDKAGNEVSVLSPTIILDTTAPSQLEITTNNGAVYTTSPFVQLSVKAYDEFGIAFMSFSTDGTTWAVKEPYTTKKSLELPPVNSEIIVYVRLFDNAGNQASGTTKIILDQSRPEVFYFRINNVSESSVAYINTNKVAFTVSVFDEGSNISDMSFGFDGITWGQWMAYRNKGTLDVPMVQGPINIYIRVRDHAGNICNITSSTVILDTMPPESVSLIINNGEATTINEQVMLRISGIDITSGLDQFRYKEGDQAWSPWFPFMTTKTVKLIDTLGEKKVYIEIKDRTGNVAGQAVASIILTKTATLPQLKVSITSYTGGENVRGIVKITGTVTGGEPTVAQIRVDGGVWQNCDGKAAWSYTWNTAGLKEGAHIIEARSSNGQENFTSGPLVLTVQNKIPETQMLGDLSFMTLLILIILAIIISAIVAAAVAVAMKPKSPHPSASGRREEISMAGHSKEYAETDRPHRPDRGRRARPSAIPIECANCGYAIEHDEHHVACSSCGVVFHDDCAQNLSGYCSKCGGGLS